MNTERMKKAANNMDLLVKIVGGIFGVVAWVLVIMGVLVIILGERMFDAGTVSLNLAYITLHLAEGTPVGMNMMEIFMGVGLITGGAVCFLVSRGAKLIRPILASMKEGRPFDSDAPANLRKVAWLTLIGGAVLQIAGIVERVLMTGALPMDQIFTSPVIAEVEYSFGFDFGFIMVACVILFLSYIFEYGQKLQQESDETL